MNYMQGSGKEDSVAASVAIADTRNKAAKKLMRLETRRTKSEILRCERVLCSESEWKCDGYGERSIALYRLRG